MDILGPSVCEPLPVKLECKFQIDHMVRVSYTWSRLVTYWHVLSIQFGIVVTWLGGKITDQFLSRALVCSFYVGFFSFASVFSWCHGLAAIFCCFTS